MAAKKVIYFTAGPNATVDELADIAKLNAVTEAQYSVNVMNGAQNAKYGETNRLAPCDFVAGTVPVIYNAKVVIDPDAIPNQALTDSQVIVNDADALEVAVTGTYTDTATFTVEDGVITAIVLS